MASRPHLTSRSAALHFRLVPKKHRRSYATSLANIQTPMSPYYIRQWLTIAEICYSATALLPATADRDAHARIAA